MRARGVVRLLVSAPCLAVLGYGAASGLLWWGGTTELSPARLRVRGEPRGAPDGLAGELLRAATVAEGKSFLDLSCAGELRDSLVRSPWVKDAEVKRAHRGRLVARVRLREPLCRIEGCGPFVLDGEGVVLPARRGAAHENLIVIKGCRVRNAVPGKRWPGEDAVAAAEVARAVSRVADLREVRVGRERGNISCVGILASGTKVVWGAPGETAAKVEKLSRALNAAQRSGRRASYIDLRFSRPVFRLAEDG